jgi:hypothetical protein
MALTFSLHQLLLAIAQDNFLKAHRDLEGHKIYKLHPLEGEPQIVNGDDVQALIELGLIDSNKKFPAATFWLTPKGQQLVEKLTQPQP